MNQNQLFRNSVLISFLLHLAIFIGFSLKNNFNFSSRTVMEIDLTKPFRIGGDPSLKPGGGTLKEAPKKEGVPLKTENQTKTTPTQPKDWVLPGPNTKELEKPQLSGGPIQNAPGGIPEGTGDGYQGTGGGVGGGDGQGGGIPLEKFPKLLNRGQILRLLRKNYPPAERDAGNQGVVVVDLHLDINGNVTGVDLIDSAGLDFDQVAQRVAQKMKFSPAIMSSRAIAVKIRQSITFELEDN